MTGLRSKSRVVEIEYVTPSSLIINDHRINLAWKGRCEIIPLRTQTCAVYQGITNHTYNDKV